MLLLFFVEEFTIESKLSSEREREKKNHAQYFFFSSRLLFLVTLRIRQPSFQSHTWMFFRNFLQSWLYLPLSIRRPKPQQPHCRAATQYRLHVIFHPIRARNIFPTIRLTA